MSVSAAGSSVGPGPESDLSLIYTGGDNFLARMKALSDAQAASDAALAELRLGQTAKAALTAAQDKQAQAEFALKNANQKAAGIIEAAQASADGIIAAATQQAVQKKAEIAAASARHEDWLAKTKASAEADRAGATDAKKDAAVALANAMAVNDAAEAVKADLDTQMAAAAKAEADFRQKSAALDSAAKSIASALGS